MQKPDHHIGDLHAGVVDVVLHIDLLSRGAQQADKRIAENRVAQMPDVRSLVGIDAGMLHQRMVLRGRRAAFGKSWVPDPSDAFVARVGDHACSPQNSGSPVKSRVDVPGPGNFESGEPVHAPERGHNFLGNDLRRLAQRPRQLQGDRGREFTELQLRRNLDRNVFNFEIIFRPQHTADVLGERFLQFQIHVGSASEILDFQGRF